MSIVWNRPPEWEPPVALGGVPEEFRALAQARLALGGRDWQVMAAAAQTHRARRIALAALELVRAVDEGEFPWLRAL